MSDFKAKMHQIRIRLRYCPRPRWGSLQRSPDTLAGFEGPTSKGGEGTEKGGMRGEGGEGRGGEGGEGTGEEAFLVMWPRRLSALNPPLPSCLYSGGFMGWATTPTRRFASRPSGLMHDNYHRYGSYQRHTF